MGYSIRDKCQKLIDLGYDEDTIVSALNMKHKQYRKLIGEKFDTLTPGAALELNMYDAELTEARAAELYYVDCADIRRARNGVIRPEATDEAVMAWLLTEHAKTRKELFASLRSKFGLRKDKALAVLKRLGYVADGTKTRCKYNMVVSLLNKGVPFNGSSRPELRVVTGQLTGFSSGQLMSSPAFSSPQCFRLALATRAKRACAESTH